MSDKQESLIFSHTRHNGDFPGYAGHYHNRYEIYFLKSGSCRYFIGDRLFDVAEGDIILIKKGTIHKTLYSDVAIERYLLNFSEEFIPEIMFENVRTLFAENIYHTPPQLISEIVTIFEKFERETENADSYSPLITAGLMQELFALMLRHPSEQTENSSSLPIEKATAYITRNYREQLTLEEMAKMCSLSVSYFSRLFKTITGFGFKEYLTIIRLKAAQSLLLHTDSSILKIAYECGFNDSNYFSVVFKEFVGISPLKYRKQNRIKGK